ncbi:hypothetical protein DPMN_113876 [Dreissena polymorpha]|uniref:Uncharacterized protein n=1 Tax=Dreissena polymorpha TaxID=45954 RepID=A0A9D4KI98_DREPO|nr:hypothetical protein DPMN_113876 [Dreissena polymorpha]
MKYVASVSPAKPVHPADLDGATLSATEAKKPGQRLRRIRLRSVEFVWHTNHFCMRWFPNICHKCDGILMTPKQLMQLMQLMHLQADINYREHVQL